MLIIITMFHIITFIIGTNFLKSFLAILAVNNENNLPFGVINYSYFDDKSSILSHLYIS